MKLYRKFILFSVFCAVLLLFFCLTRTPRIPLPRVEFENSTINKRIDFSLDLARYKLSKTIKYLPKNNLYPNYTENESLDDKPKISNGAFIKTKSKFWAAGAFPGLLWKMYDIETNPRLKKFWKKNAIAWSKPLRQQTFKNVGDMAINSLFVFEPWYRNSDGQEKNQQLLTILSGASYLAQPINNNQGRFHADIGVIGYYHTAERTDNQKHWHAFIDHTINVEQLFWAAEHHLNLFQSEKWRKISINHIKTMAKYMGTNRNPGKDGTWQRGYFEDNLQSTNYGQFLFNEAKQGWRDSSTWSRGQAWWIYATSITYQYTQDPEILTIAKEAINYYLHHLPDRFPEHLRRRGDFIPPWDFDYALLVNPDTERDSSAAAIATSGMLKLISSLPATDPDRQVYLTDVENILNNLTSPRYLTSATDPEMSILRHGCYHHYEAIKPSKNYDNGLIWGDYFFVDALINYQKNISKN